MDRIREIEKKGMFFSRCRNHHFIDDVDNPVLRLDVGDDYLCTVYHDGLVLNGDCELFFSDSRQVCLIDDIRPPSVYRARHGTAGSG